MNKTFLLILVGLLSTLYLVFNGETWQWIVVGVLYFLGTCIGGTMTYHRLLAHRSWKAPRWFEIFGTLIRTVLFTGSSIAYVAIHREHHLKSDTTEDPHSPKDSILKLHLGLKRLDANVFYAADLLKDSFHVFTHINYLLINLVYAVGIVLAFKDVFALFYAWIVPGFFVAQSVLAVNSINHTWGYRTYAIDDNSKNNLITGYLAFGEGWHNNHHAHPKESYFGKSWWEFDLAGLMIKGIEIK